MTEPPAHPRLEPRLKMCRLYAGRILLDVPFAAPAGSGVHLATFWQDPFASGWVHGAWEPGPQQRGFVVPDITDLADVLGFVAVQPPVADPPAIENPWRPPSTAPPPPPTRALEWWGYLHAIETDHLIIRGPYPSPDAAYATAQQSLIAVAHDLATSPPASNRQPHGTVRPAEPFEPAQPPATVTAVWHGESATVGDPRYGWLHVPTDRLAAALTRPASQLVARLAPYVPGVSATDAPITLAALAARYLPYPLPDITTSAPPPAPVAAGPTPGTRSSPDVKGGHVAPPSTADIEADIEDPADPVPPDPADEVPPTPRTGASSEHRPTDPAQAGTEPERELAPSPPQAPGPGPEATKDSNRPPARGAEPPTAKPSGRRFRFGRSRTPEQPAEFGGWTPHVPAPSPHEPAGPSGPPTQPPAAGLDGL